MAGEYNISGVSISLAQPLYLDMTTILNAQHLAITPVRWIPQLIYLVNRLFDGVMSVKPQHELDNEEKENVL